MEERKQQQNNLEKLILCDAESERRIEADIIEDMVREKNYEMEISKKVESERELFSTSTS